MNIKAGILFSLLSALLTTGCAKEPNPPEQPADFNTQVTDIIIPETDFNDTYYKLETAYVTYDIDMLLKNLMPRFDEKDVLQRESVSGGKEHSILIDNVTHTWSWEEQYFQYSNDSPNTAGTVSKDDAQKISDEFVTKLGYEIAANPIITETDGTFSFEYSLHYKNTPIMGNRSIDLDPPGSSEGNFVFGEFITVDVNSSGIEYVFLFHLSDIKKEVEEYHGNEDFISQDKLQTAVNTYCKEFFKGFESETPITFKVNKNTVIYMPNFENDAPILIPVILVEGNLSLHDNDIYTLYVDALTGYVFGGL